MTLLRLRHELFNGSNPDAGCIDESLKLFGEVETYFACHNWPEWGNRNIRTFLEEQLDIYRYIHDQTLRLANKGHAPVEIGEIPNAEAVSSKMS